MNPGPAENVINKSICFSPQDYSILVTKRLHRHGLRPLDFGEIQNRRPSTAPDRLTRDIFQYKTRSAAPAHCAESLRLESLIRANVIGVKLFLQMSRSHFLLNSGSFGNT